MKEIIFTILLFGGLFFLAVGTIGILRSPDIFTRAHGAAKCDTLGAILVLLSLVVYSGINFSSLKILLTIVFLWITAPTATHLIAKAAYVHKERQVGSDEDI